MVAFHKDFRVSSTVADEITFRNKIPETLKPGRLCNGLKAPDHEQKLHLDGTPKPDFQKTLDGHRDLRNLRGRPRQRRDLDDERFYRLALFALADVHGGVAAFLSVHTARRGPGRQ